MQITPSECSLFRDADWIIGNHSDELTPWIPVISMRSSYKTNFFLLPCCAYEFNGQKYCRSNTKKSIYHDYMDYVEKICNTCGFIVRRDRLRIPSTKRICFVSFGRLYDECEQDGKVEEEVVKLIHGLSVDCTEKAATRWLNDYKPREAVERVRNCTQLNKKVINDIVSHVAELLLRDYTTKIWNEGIPKKLSDLVKSMPDDLMVQLKNECGGLQTVLRNNQNIFQLQNGFVKFRKPTEKIMTDLDKWKKRTCWFYNNHPDSCPLPDESCSYRHEIENISS